MRRAGEEGGEPPTASCAPRGHGARRSLARPSLTSIIARTAGRCASHAPLSQPGSKCVVMSALNAAAEDAGDIDPVADPAARAGDRARAGDGAEEGQAGRERPRRLRHVAPDHGDAVPSGHGRQPAVELLEPGEPHPPVERQREHGRDRTPSHRGDVAQVALEELRPHRRRSDRPVEMPTVDHRVDRDRLPAATEQRAAPRSRRRCHCGDGGELRPSQRRIAAISRSSPSAATERERRSVKGDTAGLVRRSLPGGPRRR